MEVDLTLGVDFAFQTGDISTYNADTAIVFSDSEFSTRAGAARAILDRGGLPFREAYNEALAANSLFDLVVDVSKVETLPFKSVIVLSVRAWTMRPMYATAFRTSLEKGHKRIVMPLLGSDSQDANITMLHETCVLKDIVSKFPFQNLQSVTLIDKSRAIIEEFTKVFYGMLPPQISSNPVVLGVVVPRAEPEYDNWKKVERSKLPISRMSANDILNNECPVCFYDFATSHLGKSNTAELEADPIVQLTDCIHRFHLTCIKQCFENKKQCPMCLRMYNKTFGNQPARGTMKVIEVPGRVPGLSKANSWFRLKYTIPIGIQTEGHVRPGFPHSGTTRTAWVPNDEGGREIMELLRKAFDQRFIFTIGDSETTGQRNVPVWAIFHNTNQWVAPNYYNRVKAELARVGITADK